MDAERLTPTQRRLAAKFPPPSRYFRWIGDLAPCRVVTYARESSRWQDANGNLQCQIELLRRLLKKLGFTVIKVFKEAASGQRYERPLLERAASFARRRNAVLVAEAVNRYVRS
jgi:DNA invertase Pin-like site-specific DNA recombinase